jgi:hypothetical protein
MQRRYQTTGLSLRTARVATTTASRATADATERRVIAVREVGRILVFDAERRFIP